MFVSEAHGGFGGIAQYNRDIITALSSFDAVEEIVVLPRIIMGSDGSVPAKVTYDAASAGSAANFVRRSAVQAMFGGRFDLVYCGHINLAPIAALIAQVRRIPMVLAIYGIDAWGKPGRLVGRCPASVFSLVISISQITLDRFSAWSRVSPEKCVVLPNAIDAAKFGIGTKSQSLARRLGVNGRTVVMTFGRMSADERYKGFDEVIDVMPRLVSRNPSIVYVAAGEGSDRERLQAKARALGVADYVIFPGRIDESEKADLYRLADAYVMPSSGEGFGFVVLEALACGIPVVASAADGTREAVRDGELGIVINPANPDDLERGIFSALAQPKGVPPGLSYFAFERFAERLREALSRVVNIGPDAPSPPSFRAVVAS